MRGGCLSLDVTSFNAAISSCKIDGRWPSVAPVFDEMRRGGLSLDVISFNAAISSCEKGRRWPAVAPVLDE
eukprot:12423252-Karenia_brevis.AAC.1